MTIVSTKEFNAHQDKYFNMAIDEQVFVKRGKYMFHINCSNPDTVEMTEQAILEPDDDLHRALSSEEFRKRLTVVLNRVDRKYANINASHTLT